METKMAENMKSVLEKLITERGVDGGLECQLMLAGIGPAAGTVTKTEFENVYRMVAVTQKQGAQGRQGLEMVDIFLPVELVVMVTLPMSEKDKPRIVQPNGSSGRIIGA